MERPIILKAHEVRGILDGRQTQLRRIIKPQPLNHAPTECFELRNTMTWKYKPTCLKRIADGCPFGQVGDRLWGRETFGYQPDLEECEGWSFTLPKGHTVVYRADKDIPNYELSKGWCSSATMNRWASRILLEIVSVRVERVQNISRADAAAEGVCLPWGAQPWPAWCKPSRWPEENYLGLWDEINGPMSHKANPFVWVLTFKRVDA